jgi:hypothetical protein
MRTHTLRRAPTLAGLLGLILNAGAAVPATAQNASLDEVGALLVLPVVTDTGAGIFGSGGPTVTAAVVTNAGPAVRLHLNVLSGDEGDSWSAQDFDCDVTAHETTLFVFEPSASGYGSRLHVECRSPGSASEQTHEMGLNAATGVMVVTLEDPATGDTVNTNQLLGDGTIVDFGAGAAWSAGAISFQGVASAPGVEDRAYRFDNSEYTRFPSALASNYLAPRPGGHIDAELILFTLDGTTGQVQVPEAQVSIDFVTDRGGRSSTSHRFDCFDIVSLGSIDGRFELDADDRLGGGHLVIRPEAVTYGNLAHDASFDGGPGAVPGVRRTPVHGWLVQTIGTPAGDAAVGRALVQSQLPLVPHPGDTPVLNAP